MGNEITRIKIPLKILEDTKPDVFEVGDVVLSPKLGLGVIIDEKIGDDGKPYATIIDWNDHGVKEHETGYLGRNRSSWRPVHKVCPAPPDGDYDRVFSELLSDVQKGLEDPEYFEYLDEGQESQHSTALITSSGPQQLQAAHDKHRKISEYVNSIQSLIEYESHKIMLKAKQLAEYVSEMQGTMRRLSKVIGIFELYLGVEEAVIQIRSGESTTDRLHVRQMILFADEELAVLDKHGDGIDWSEIEQFDEWLATSSWDVVDRLVPESKCIVAIRPSRQRRKISGFMGTFFDVQDEDRRLYLLIRNGENLYRIYTGVDRIGTLLFPSRAEFEEVRRITLTEQDKEDALMSQAKNAMLLQGIIDRTPILLPFSEANRYEDKPNVLNEENVTFIYDGEPAFGDGHKSFRDWQIAMNKKITRGTRVLIADNVSRAFSRYRTGDDHRYRFKRYYDRNSFNVPELMEPGVYTVSEVTKGRIGYSQQESNIYWIKYHPGGYVYEGWSLESHERKNAVSFSLHHTDQFLFNYDELTFAEIDYYLESRHERANYRDVLPVLNRLREERRTELEWENHFIDLVVDQTGKDRSVVVDAVDWWKSRVIHRRPIKSDESKALRMIIRKIGGAWKNEDIKHQFEKGNE